MNQQLSTNTYTYDFTNAAKSFISHQMQEKWDEKVTARYIFQNKCYFSIFFCPLFLGTWKNVLNFQNVICFYIPYIFSFFYFWMLQFTDRFSSLNHQVYWKKKRYDLNATLPCQISSRNESDYCHFGFSMATIILFSRT